MFTEAMEKVCQESDSGAFVMEILAHQLPGITGTVNNHVDKENQVDIKPFTKFQTKNQ